MNTALVYFLLGINCIVLIYLYLISHKALVNLSSLQIALGVFEKNVSAHADVLREAIDNVTAAEVENTLLQMYMTMLAQLSRDIDKPEVCGLYIQQLEVMLAQYRNFLYGDIAHPHSSGFDYKTPLSLDEYDTLSLSLSARFAEATSQLLAVSDNLKKESSARKAAAVSPPTTKQ